MHPLIQQMANQYKKLWETIEIFLYQIKYDEKKYYHILYLRFKKPTGILIVREDGEIVPNQTAQAIVAPINYYNNIAKAAVRSLFYEKDRDITPMKDLHQLLEDNSSALADSPASASVQDYRNVHRMLTTIIEGQKSLQQIFEQMKAIDIDARERRRFITLEDVENFVSLNEDYQSIMYRQGRVQQENKASLERLAQYIKSNRAAFAGAKRMVEVLQSFLASDVARTLDHSLKTFEQGLNGERFRFDSSETGIAQMLELYRQKTQSETRTLLYPLLRNP